MSEKDTIEIPLEIFQNKNLDYTGGIGALAILMAIPYMSKEEKEKWENNEDFKEEIEYLQKNGILIENDHGEIVLNLKDDDYPESFWEYDGKDFNGNIVYRHSSLYGNFQYRIKAVLKDMNISWEYCGDEELDNYLPGFTYKLVWNSLEEAMKDIKESIESEKIDVEQSSDCEIENSFWNQNEYGELSNLSHMEIWKKAWKEAEKYNQKS